MVPLTPKQKAAQVAAARDRAEKSKAAREAKAAKKAKGKS